MYKCHYNTDDVPVLTDNDFDIRRNVQWRWELGGALVTIMSLVLKYMMKLTMYYEYASHILSWSFIDPGPQVSSNPRFLPPFAISGNLIFFFFFQDSENLERYLRWSDAVVVVYSITSKQSYQHAKGLFQEIAELQKTKEIHEFPVVVLGNKNEMERYRWVRIHEMQFVCAILPPT